MGLTEFDQNLITRCISRQAKAWEVLVDRYAALILQVAENEIRTRGEAGSDQKSSELVTEVFLELLRDDFALLRNFRQNCSLASYLAVLARRIIVMQLSPRL